MVRGNGSAGAESPESQWACDGFTDREEEESRGSEVNGGHPRVTAERQRTSETEREKTEGDLLFAQKCAELQGFVRPLLELLNGLKGGRFDRGLSSFQQSAAMDRIQRIVGVLRRPSIGEKYMNTLLQVETMLKMWFPQVSPLAPPTAPTLFPPHLSPRDSPSSTPPHRHRDQSHIPVKVRTHKHSRAHNNMLISCESSTNKAGLCSEPGPTLVLVVPILSPWKAMEGKQLLPVMPPPTTRGSPAMQDSVISSTTPFNNLQSQSGAKASLLPGRLGKRP
uniref:Circadian-associated transcriptional repressor n=1 Tax=Oncorhynchus kisutch TaxID=8019 RepID=A0A8C7CR84_ONCKI